MKKLIGVSLIALFAMMAENTAHAQLYSDSSYSTTIVKNKDDKQKVKVVSTPPANDVCATSLPGEVFQEAPFFSNRKYKFNDGDRKVIIYDNR